MLNRATRPRHRSVPLPSQRLLNHLEAAAGALSFVLRRVLAEAEISEECAQAALEALLLSAHATARVMRPVWFDRLPRGRPPTATEIKAMLIEAQRHLDRTRMEWVERRQVGV